MYMCVRSEAARAEGARAALVTERAKKESVMQSSQES